MNENQKAVEAGNLFTASAYELTDTEVTLVENLKTFDDGNDYVILFKYSSTAYRLLTFTLKEGVKLYWSSDNYFCWEPRGTDKILSSKLYSSVSVDGFGSASTPSLGSYYFSSTARPTSRDVVNVIYSTIDIYDTDYATIIRQADADPFVEESGVEIRSVKPSKLYYTGDAQIDFIVEYRVHPATTLDRIEYNWVADTPPFAASGIHEVDITAWTTAGKSDTVRYSLFIYDIENPYPPELPPLIEDGHQEVVVGRNKDGVLSAITFNAVVGSGCCFFNTDTSFGISNNIDYSKRIQGVVAGFCCYLFDESLNDWVLSSEDYPYPNRTTTSTVHKNNVIYTTVDIYSDANKTTLLYQKNPRLKRENFDAKTMQVREVIEYPDPRTFDTTVEQYILWYGTYSGSAGVYCFAIRNPSSRVTAVNFKVASVSSSSMVFDAGKNEETCLLRYRNGRWEYAVNWRVGGTGGFSAVNKDTLFKAIYEINNVNLYLATHDDSEQNLIYETILDVEPADIFFNVDGVVRQGVVDNLSKVSFFNGERWIGIEVTDDETDVKIFIDDNWKNIRLF